MADHHIRATLEGGEGSKKAAEWIFRADQSCAECKEVGSGHMVEMSVPGEKETWEKAR